MSELVIESGKTLEELHQWYLKEKEYVATQIGMRWGPDNMSPDMLKGMVRRLYARNQHLDKGFRVFLLMYCYKTNTTSIKFDNGMSSLIRKFETKE